MTVHVAGNVCIDWRFGVARLPAPGETVNAHGLSFDLGGKGALQAIAAARTGAAVSFRAAVGDDADGAQVRAMLRAAGLSDAGLVVVDRPTDRSVILVEDGGENAIVTAVEAATAFRPDDAGWTWRPGDLVLVQNNFATAVTEAILRRVAAEGLRTVWNGSPLGHVATPALALVGLAVVNRGEGEALTGAASPEGILAGLVRRGARAAVVTLGADGAAVLAAAGEGPRFVPAARVRATDTSGAGDVFCGVLAGLLDHGAALVEAAGVASAAAGLAVTRNGTMRAIPSAAEIAALAGQAAAASASRAAASSSATSR